MSRKVRNNKDLDENIAPTKTYFFTNSTVQNAAIGGTTADQWATAGTDALNGCSTTIDYDVVYMSYGGNDLLNSGCSISGADLATKMANAIEHTRNTLYPSATSYVLAGYCQVAQNVDCPGGAEDFQALDVALTSLATTYAGSNVKIFNHMTVCGGTSSSYSDASYFQDAIHLNAKGYCTYFTQSDMATQLQCGDQASIDCDSNPPTLNGETCGLGVSSSSDSDSTILYIGIGVGAVVGIVILAAVLYTCAVRSRK